MPRSPGGARRLRCCARRSAAGQGVAVIGPTLAAEDPRICVLHIPENRNYGHALAHGIAAARYDWIGHDGIDLPLAPEDFGPFIRAFTDADVVVARRHDRHAHSPWRRLTSVVNVGLLRILFAPRTHDLNFVQFYRRS